MRLSDKKQKNLAVSPGENRTRFLPPWVGEAGGRLYGKSGGMESHNPLLDPAVSSRYTMVQLLAGSGINRRLNLLESRRHAEGRRWKGLLREI
jgi:hypothetical protein